MLCVLWKHRYVHRLCHGLLQSQDHKPLFSACCVEQASSYSSCSLLVWCIIITQLFSSSGSDPGPVIDISLSAFYTIILKLSFSQSLFLHSCLSLAHTFISHVTTALRSYHCDLDQMTLIPKVNDLKNYNQNRTNTQIDTTESSGCLVSCK